MEFDPLQDVVDKSYLHGASRLVWECSMQQWSPLSAFEGVALWCIIWVSWICHLPKARFEYTKVYL